MPNLLLPQWRCHKIVGALQIRTVKTDSEGVTLEFYEPNYRAVHLTNAQIARYKPVADDYLVQYDDDYLSISPREPFERGYTQL